MLNIQHSGLSKSSKYSASEHEEIVLRVIIGIIALTVLVGCRPSATASSDLTATSQSEHRAKDEQAIRAVLADWLDALKRGDMVALERILPSDYQITISSGAVLNRDKDLEVIKNGQVQFESASVDSLQIRFFSDAAVVTGIGRFVVKNPKGATLLSERFTDVYAKRRGEWHPVASHSTPLKTPASAEQH